MRWLTHAAAVVVLGLVALRVAVDVMSGSGILEGIPFLMILVAALAVGWLLARRLPRNPLGWILISIPALFTVGLPVQLAADALYPVAPRIATVLWVAFGADGVDGWSWLPPVWLLLSQLPLRFPTGRLPSPRWRWFQCFSVVALVVTSVFLILDTAQAAPGIPNPIYFGGVSSQPVLVLAAFGSLAISFIGSIASLFVRYRSANAVERTQIRWVLWSVAVSVGLLVASWVTLAIGGSADFAWLFLVGYALIPISIGVSVLRYRLYDIDRIISRTASYAVVSLFVIGVYLLVVTSVHWVLPDLPAIGVALATLVAAALFLPVLRWVRRLVDRRFDRERYNAEKVVDAFGEHLRTDLDPHSTADDLVRAIEQTLQPASVGIWTAGTR